MIKLLREKGFTAPLRPVAARELVATYFILGPKTPRGGGTSHFCFMWGGCRVKKILRHFSIWNCPAPSYVVGDGPMLTTLKRMYPREVEAGRLVFFGECKGERLGALYCRRRCGCLSQRYRDLWQCHFGSARVRRSGGGLSVAGTKRYFERTEGRRLT